MSVVTIEQLVAGGDGLARDDAGVVFVPLVAPGDRVRIEIEPGKGTRRGRLLEVLDPGPSRVTPPCPLVGTCGGCDLQHVEPGAQGAAKFAIVRESLVRLGGFRDPPMRPLVASPKAFRYRRRMKAHLAKGGWGFSQRASNRVVPVPACLLVEERVEEFATDVAAGLREVGLAGSPAFSVDLSDAGLGAVHLELASEPTMGELARASKLVRGIKGLRGVVLTGPEGKPKVAGDPVLVEAGHRRLRVRPDLFAQANRLGARLLAEAVAETVAPGARVLELFAGSGTLSLGIAERAASLVATEGDGPALDLLKLAASELGRPVRTIAGPAKRVAEGLAAEATAFDHVVLDPPRIGAKDVMPAIVKIASPRITYVSCDPATFARDAQTLVRAGWSLEAVTPFDLFPHTHHVELVATFSR